MYNSFRALEGIRGQMESYQLIGVWLSLVERHVRDVEAEGSNPFTPTKQKRRVLCVFFVLEP